MQRDKTRDSTLLTYYKESKVNMIIIMTKIILIIFLTWFSNRLKRLSMVCIFLTKNYIYFGINGKRSHTLQKWAVKIFWIYNKSHCWIWNIMILKMTIFKSPKRITFIKELLESFVNVFIYTFGTVIKGYMNCIEMVAV